MKKLWTGLLCIGLAAAPLAAAGPYKTENVVVIVTDGLRWQEVFRGAETALVSDKPGGVEDVEATKRAFWRETPGEKREALLPFLWTVVAKEGQIYGNRDAGSTAQVTNGYKFSYPGYNEIITGAGDKRIDKNEYGLNPNVSVFEWMNGQPDFHDRVAVVGGWDVFPAIFNRERSHLDMRTGWNAPFSGATLTPRQELLNTLYRTTTHEFSDMPWDGFLQQTLLDYVQTHKPRLLFVGFGETDEWAHNGRYDLILQSAHNVDALHPGALDDDAGNPAVQGQDDVHHHDRPRPRRWAGELEASRLERRRRRVHVDRRPGAGHAAARRAQERRAGDAEPDRRDGSDPAGQGLARRQPQGGAAAGRSHHSVGTLAATAARRPGPGAS